MKIYISLSFLLITILSFGQIDRSKVPQPGPAPKVEIGQYSKFELANGMKVIVVENHRLPQVTFSLSFIFDQPLEAENSGISMLTASLLGTGTKTKSKDQINQAIDYMGANLNPHATGIEASSLKQFSDNVLNIMADVAINSVFSAEELEKSRTQIVSDLASKKEDPKSIASNVFSSIIYGNDHPYGEFETENSVKKVSLDMCKTYYQNYFIPNIAYLSIVGDISPEEAKKLAEKYFGAWKAGKEIKQNYQQPQAPAKTRVAIAERPQSVQSVIRVGYPIDLTLNNPDYIKTRVTNTILGGVFCRLDQNLREKHAFTYGARSVMNANPLVGSFEAYTSARNSVTDSAIDQILIEMKRMCKEQVPSEELQQVKNFISGNFALSLEEPKTIAAFAINIERFNLPKNFYSNYLKSIESISAIEVQQTACKYIKPENAVIFAVGKTAEISDKLKRFSPDQKVEIYDTEGKRKE